MVDHYRDANRSTEEPRNIYPNAIGSSEARYTTSVMSNNRPQKELTRSGSSREKFPSTSFVIETLKEKHRMLEEKLGIVV